MNQTLKGMLIGYSLPIISALIVLYLPVYNTYFTIMTALLIIVLIIMPIVLRIRFHSKKEKAYKITLVYQLYAFTFFFIFPLLKVFTGKPIVQLLLIGLFIGFHYLSKIDQQKEIPIVFPGKDKEHSKFAYAYYAVPVILVIAGGGGNIIITRHITNLLGNDVAMSLFAIVLYLFACWFIFLFGSLVYKFHVKEGFLEK